MSPIPGGYILIARSITENPDVFDGCPPLRLKLWVWMLAKAFWKDGEKLQRGQLLTSIDEMREAMSYKIGYRTSTPTKAEIRNSYEAFMKASMISTGKSTRGMIITIEKYNTYQDFSGYEQHSESHNEDSTKIQTTTQDRESSIKQKKKKDYRKTSSFYPHVCDEGAHPEPSTDIKEFAEQFQRHIAEAHGRKAPEVTATLIESCCKTVDQIIRLDGFTLDEIRETMRWAVKDDFWQDNVMSLANLRRSGKGGVSKFKTIRAKFEATQQISSKPATAGNASQQAQACLGSLLELRRSGKWKSVSPYSSTMKIDTAGLPSDPVRDTALKACPPPNDTWKIDHEWVRDFTKAYEAAAKEAA